MVNSALPDLINDLFQKFLAFDAAAKAVQEEGGSVDIGVDIDNQRMDLTAGHTTSVSLNVDEISACLTKEK